jgi:cytochrome c553
MAVLARIIVLAVVVAIVLVAGHRALTTAAEGSGRVAAAARSTCGLCHGGAAARSGAQTADLPIRAVMAATGTPHLPR